MATIQLQNIDGRLYFPFGSYPDATKPMILVRLYREGDCDTIAWPMRGDTDRVNLSCAVYDAFMCVDGSGDVRPVMLPDGTMFDCTDLLP
jgi:hypothetical protein